MARKSRYQEATAESSQSKWNAGLYIRLSREDGDKLESESVFSQKAILQRFISEHDGVDFGGFYIDDGWSGTDFDRPAFQRMIGDITCKKINCVIVKDLSRFGRNYVEAGKYIEAVFPMFKVRFIAVNDGIDSAENPSSINNVIVPFKNILNDEYCRDISVKVRSSLDIRRKQGKFIGSFAPYGYKKDPEDKNKLIPDADSAPTVVFIYEKFLSGYSILGIARELNARGILNPSAYKRQCGLNCNRSKKENGTLWQDSTVRRILTNQLYIGNMEQKKSEVVSYKIHISKAVESGRRIVVENTHTPIISREVFDKVQSLLKRDTRTSPNSGKLSLFAGFIKCADCGRAMQKRTVKQPYKTYEYYACSTYRKMHSGLCTKHAIRADVLEEAVLTSLNKYICLAVNFESLVEKINNSEKKSNLSSRIAAELEKNRREQQRTKELLMDLYPDYKSGILNREQYFCLKERYENSLVKIQSRIDGLENEREKCKNGVDGSNLFIANFKKFNGLKQLTREALVELVENIFIHEGGGVEISLKCRDEFMIVSDYIEKNREPVQSLKD